MFSTLNTYVLRQMLQTLAISSAALVVLVWLMNSLRFFDWFINKNLSVGIFLQLTVLLMPGFLTVFMPIALFAVSLFTYSRLVADRELVVMRAAGLSPWQLAQPALMIATVLTVIGYILTIWVVPEMERRFSELHHDIRNELSQLVLKEGQFNRAEDNLIIYVRDREPGGELLGLLIQSLSLHHLP
ncbi:MAG: LptF/LptG family permease, partial [Rhodospirillaceae bacterium]